MKYLSDHARIVILEEKLQQLAAIVTANIVDSGRALDCIGQVVEGTPVPPEKIPKTLIPLYSEQVWENQQDQTIVQPFDDTGTTCPVHNRLRNPNELSYK